MRFFFVSVIAGVLALPALADPNFWKHEWPRTDFGRSAVPFIEILSGGPPKDGIPAIDAPVFLAVSEVGDLDAREPVITLEIDGTPPRAYPIRYLHWHEIVNDIVGGVPVAVTYCPLCNSAITFDRRVAARTLSFGVSGKLRNSDMIMYDRETESWWQQAIGQGVVGEMMGQKLRQLPAWMEPFGAYAARNPDGLVMAQPPWPRQYGANPYRGYDRSHRPFLYSGENPPFDIDPLMRVIRVGTRAWTMERLRQAGEINEAGVRITWEAGMASPLDTTQISQGRDIGWVRVRDTAGADLAHDVMFAFAFHAFHPNGTWMLGK